MAEKIIIMRKGNREIWDGKKGKNVRKGEREKGKKERVKKKGLIVVEEELKALQD